MTGGEKGVLGALRRRALLAGNLLLLALALLLGRLWYADQVGTGDAILQYRPGTGDVSAGWQFDFMDRLSEDYASSPWAFTWKWYKNFNGRFSQGLTMSPFALFSRTAARPEDFPWWLIRGLTLFCLGATPLVLAALLRECGDRAVLSPVLAAAALWAVWSLHPTVYVSAVFFVFSLVGHFLAAYLAALLLVWMLRRPLPAWRRRDWAFAMLGLLYLCLYGEQYLPSVPVLFVTVPLVRWFPWGMRARTYLTFAAFSAAAVGAAAWIYFASPGQEWRNPLIRAQAPELSVATLVEWYRTSSGAGYRTLFSAGGEDVVGLVHTPLLAFLLAAVAGLARACARRRSEGEEDEGLETALGVGVLALGFLAAYHASLATLLVSRYFPPRAEVYPALLLGAGLVFALRLAWLLAEAAAARAEPQVAGLRGPAFPAAVALIALAFLGAGNLRGAALRHHEYRMYQAARLHYLERVLDLYRTTGKRYYLLRNGPRGDYTFEARGLWAYLQWRGYPQLLVDARGSRLRADDPEVVVLDFFGEEVR